MSLPGSASTDTPPASPNISTIQVSPERSNSLQLPLDTSEVTPPSSPGETSTQTSPNGDDSNSRVQSPTDKKRDASPSDSTSATSSPTSKSSLFSTARSQHRYKTHNNIVLKNYEGEKNDEGLPHGFGKIDYVDGSYYEGEWQNGYRHGKGTWAYANSDKYVGDWAHGHKHGHGIWTLTNGDRYEGQFFDDARNGKGEYYFKTGDVFIGNYVEDIKEGMGDYTAKVTTPCKDVATSGKYRYFEGDHYTGNFHKNNRHGFGKQWSKNGDYYEGEWVNHYKKGQGKLIKANGEVIEGIWEDDILIELTQPPVAATSTTTTSNACVYITCAAILITCAYILGMVTMALLSKPTTLCLPSPNVISFLEDKSGGCKISTTSLVIPNSVGNKVGSSLSVVCNTSTTHDDAARSYIIGVWYDIPLDIFDEIYQLELDHSWDIRSEGAIVTVSNYSYNNNHHSFHNTNFNDKFIAAMNQSTILYLELKLDSVYINTTEHIAIEMTLPIRLQALIASNSNSNSNGNSNISLLTYNIYGILDDVVEYRVKTDRVAHSNNVLQLPMPVKKVEANYKSLYYYGYLFLAMISIGLIFALCRGGASANDTVLYDNIDDTIDHAVYVKTINVNVLIINMFEGASRHSNSFNVKIATNSGKVIVFNRAGHKSKYTGQLVITNGMPEGHHIFYGRIDNNGTLYMTKSATPEVTEVIQEFSDNPATVAARYGRITGGCSFCHHPLSDERSLAVGYGLKCAKRYGLPWGV